MKYINEKKIAELLQAAPRTTPQELDRILAKSRSLQRLTLAETAALLSVEDPAYLQKIFAAAAYVKDHIYGSRVVLFAPLYISNICANCCAYCSFNAKNKMIERKALTVPEIQEQVKWLLQRGHKRILMVAGEAAPQGKTNIEYYVESVKAVYSVNVGPHRIKRVNINCAPLTVEEFQQLKAAGIGTFQIFQETYHEATYRQVHTSGPKQDPDNRIDAVDRAFTAGIDDVGVGVLLGLYDYRFEILALLMHIEHLEEKFKVGPHTISVPRIEPAVGSDLSRNVPHKLADNDFKKLVAVLRLAVPYTGIILSTRETADMRDELFNVGVSQISAESRTSPGGYTEGEGALVKDTQFILNDRRSLDEIVGSLIERKFIPSFCAACYRKARTGETFMDLAKPGTIKGKCSVNALITLKEYLDDFASPAVKKAGYQLIDDCSREFDEKTKAQLAKFFADVDKGIRDEYV
jgi:2-iminoacetate synthase